MAEPYSFEAMPGLGSVGAEGPNELMLLWSEFALRRPKKITAQPETAMIAIGDRVIKHIVDYLVAADDGMTRIDVRGAVGFVHNPFLAKRIKAIASAYMAAGLRHEVATAARLRQEPMASNVKLVFEAAARPVPDDDRKRILARLEAGAMTIAELAGDDCIDRIRRDLASLHARGFITLDLLSGPIGPATKVTAGRQIQLPPWWRVSTSKEAAGCGGVG
jgi:hypothetical protein